MDKYNADSHVGPEIKLTPISPHGIYTIDMSDFPYLRESASNDKPDDIPMEMPSTADTPMDYTDLVRDSAFLGEIPFDEILTGIENQFNDYIGTEDKTDYVEAFYNQIHASYASIDDEVEHPQEIREVLDDYMARFVSRLGELFEQRLCISLIDLEAEEIDYDDMEYEISVLYDYFILNARDNFKTAITRDVCGKLDRDIKDDKEFFKTVNGLMRYHSPLIMVLGPMEFLRLTNGNDVYEMYEDGRVSGNFLKKYSPRFYQYEDFEADIIADITLKMQTKAEMVKQLGSK